MLALGHWSQQLQLQAQEWWCTGLAAPWHAEYSQSGIELGPLHWQADSHPLYHQGSTLLGFLPRKTGKDVHRKTLERSS